METIAGSPYELFASLSLQKWIAGMASLQQVLGCLQKPKEAQLHGMEARLMYARYRSDHPNYAHQLFVTPSKHIYALKDGRLKWQSKEMEVKLPGIAAAEREHIVYFLLADHCSAALYAEVHSCRSLPRIRDFLLRAWQKKTDHFFHGLPKVVGTPKALAEIEPELLPFIENYGVSPFEPTSGFQAGVHQIRNFEKSLANSFYSNPLVTIAEVHPLVEQAMRWLNESTLPRARMTRREIWERGVAAHNALVTI